MVSDPGDPNESSARRRLERRRRARLCVAALAIVVVVVATLFGVRLFGSDAARQTTPAVATSMDGPSAGEPRVAPARTHQSALPATGPAARTTPVPILMYHVIAAAPENARYPGLFVTPARFAEHMAYLARHHYHVVALQRVWDHWHGGTRLPLKPVVVSFDDGFRSWYMHAYPILRKHGWVGTMNLAVSHLNAGDIHAALIRKLVAAGWELDSHTLTHPDLTLLRGRDLRREVAGSRAVLRKLFGVQVNFFCYPSGRYNKSVIAEVRRAGYLGATTTVGGVAVPGSPFTLRRIRIDHDDDAANVGAKLARP
jgi:peptidoglycan/xylan/chitin deacetylase (PgdA/CDA1 family)